MKFLTRKESVARKILIILLVSLILIFAVTPNYSVQATEVLNEEDMPDEGEGIIGSLLKQIIQIIVAVGDIVMGTLNHFMLGADGFTSAMLSPDNDNIGNEDSWLYVGDDEEIDFEFGEGTISTADFFGWILGVDFDIPNFLYSPEAIFSNNIAALDVNFLNPNTYTAITDSAHSLDPENAEQASESAASGVLRQTISDWYISFRNIAIVGLLSVLVYLGIRILISSTAVDKAKYKESLRSWVVALCLVFFIHFIMSALLMITDRFTDLFNDSVNGAITVAVANPDGGEDIRFRTNLIGLIRFNAQSVSMYNTAAYSILYLIMVMYTVVFTIMYFKRFLYMAFFTMIAPLVALTYPIDKAGDGQAQAFNLWFKEYTMNLVLQPVHLILYVALISSAMELVKQNVIYAIVAIGFLIPAEKFIKKMFGLDKAETPSGFGSFAAGAATMSGLKQVASVLGGGNKGKSGKDGNSTAVDKDANGRVRTQDRGFLESFGNNNQEGLPDSDGQQPIDRLGDGNEPEAQSDEHQRMLDDRAEWQRIADDPNASDMDREEALQQVEFLNDDMKQKGYATERDPIEQSEQEGQGDQQNQQEQLGTTNQSGNNSQNTIMPTPVDRSEYRKKRAIRGIKKAGKFALKGAKIATQGLGIAGGAMVGLAAGAATGDLSNAITYMGAGAVAGRAIGKAAGNLPEGAVNLAKGATNTIEDKVDEYRYNKDKDMYGVGYAAEQAAIRQNQREERRFLDNKEEQEKYEEMAGRIKKSTGHDVKTEDLMRSAYDYKKAGITDEKQIENGLTMEAKHGGVNGENHENMMDIVNMANTYGRDYVLDDKKRNSLQGVIKDKVKGEQNQNKVWDFYTEALGINENTAKRYAINPNNQATRQRNSRQSGQSRPTNSPKKPSQS